MGWKHLLGGSPSREPGSGRRVAGPRETRPADEAEREWIELHEDCPTVCADDAAHADIKRRLKAETGGAA